MSLLSLLQFALALGHAVLAAAFVLYGPCVIDPPRIAGSLALASAVTSASCLLTGTYLATRQRHRWQHCPLGTHPGDDRPS